MSHCLVQELIVLMAYRSLSVGSSMFSPTAMTAVSSANVAILVFALWGTSYVYNRDRTGPNTLPCGTPAFIFLRFEYLLPCFILNSLPEK
jgi:hypothetical protein